MSLVEKLREEILSGRRQPGSLLSQTELARAFGISRIPVRDALQSLAAEKLVTIVPGKGAQVITVSIDEITEIYDLRIMLEVDLLRRSIEQASKDDDNDVKYAFDRSSLEAGRPGWSQGDWEFHAAIYRLARRPKSLEIVRELRTSCMLRIRQYQDLADDTPRWLDDHAAIVASFVARDGGAAASRLTEHLGAARSRLLAHMASAA
ncbi:MAG: GntR family transcriptional regulator [Rhizobium sp.]|nr:MAG: GntR family transcriptional regulator [Rhizobium sp.]